MKARLYSYFIRKDTSIDEAAKFLSKSDCLKDSSSLYDEYKPVELKELENLPLLFEYMNSNLTKYALLRARYNLALGINNYKVTK